jgi:hypothetical protein
MEPANPHKTAPASTCCCFASARSARLSGARAWPFQARAVRVDQMWLFLRLHGMQAGVKIVSVVRSTGGPWAGMFNLPCALRSRDSVVLEGHLAPADVAVTRRAVINGVDVVSHVPTIRGVGPLGAHGGKILAALFYMGCISRVARHGRKRATSRRRTDGRIRQIDPRGAPQHDAITLARARQVIQIRASFCRANGSECEPPAETD